MSDRNLVKSIQDIMRKDVGVDGDAQRISQLCWMFFLKIVDDQDQELDLLKKGYISPVPKGRRWRDWAANPEGITGEALLSFVNGDLFPTLKALETGGSGGAIRVTKPLILFGDHTRETKLIDFDFVVGADGVKLLQPIGLFARYYFLALTWLPLDSRGYGRHFKLLRASRIPLPPLAEQHRIVAKVDEMMGLCDRLEAGLVTINDTRRRLLDALLAEGLAPAEAMAA